MEYIEQQTEEAFEMIIADFMGLDPDKPVITETVWIIEKVLPITTFHHFAFLYVQEELFRKQNWERNDQERQDILAYMNSSPRAIALKVPIFQ